MVKGGLTILPEASRGGARRSGRWVAKKPRCQLLLRPVSSIYANKICDCFSLEHATLLFVGDISFAGPVKYYVEHNFHSYNDSFNDVASFVRGADISVANLESPFVNEDVYRYKYKGKRLIFLDSSPHSAPALR